jgi:hypothetical protein
MKFYNNNDEAVGYGLAIAVGVIIEILFVILIK